MGYFYSFYWLRKNAFVLLVISEENAQPPIHNHTNVREGEEHSYLSPSPLTHFPPSQTVYRSGKNRFVLPTREVVKRETFFKAERYIVVLLLLS